MDSRLKFNSHVAPYMPILRKLFPDVLHSYEPQLLSYLNENSNHINDDLSFLSVLGDFIRSTEFSDSAEVMDKMDTLKQIAYGELSSQMSDVREPTKMEFGIGVNIERPFEILDASHVPDFVPNKGTVIGKIKKYNRPNSGVYA